MIDEHACPICLILMQQPGQPAGDKKRIDCPRCGQYWIAGSANASIPQELEKDPKARAILSHAIRRMQGSSSPPLITNALAHQLLQSGSLPSPAQQAENLILWLGQNTPAPGEAVEFDDRPLTAIIGALNESGVEFILTELTNQGLLDVGETLESTGTLTFKGWQRYEELQRGQSRSRKGFMAMSFKNETLNDIFVNYFKPAAKAAGFDLIRVDENPPAGLIDAHIQNEIRTARFLVADLTDQNAGAYWEAGFAEGLGKPVIYTCEKQVFLAQGTHFDTSHFHTILWEKEKPAEAGSKLRETIRVTLPAEAKLMDD